MKRLLLLFFLFLILVVPVVSAAGFDIYIDEGGKVTSFYDEYYIARANGTLTITNPSDTEFFNIIIPLYMSTYTLRSPNSTATNYIDNTGIYVLDLPANSNITFEYEIGGISTEKFTDGDSSILETGLSAFDFKIYSNVMGSLLKAPFEDPSITGRNNTRLISAHLTNPTGFDFNVDMVRVVKTPDLDPSVQLGTWDFSSKITSLGPHENVEFDFFDENAFEGEVYWLQTDIYLDDINLYATNNLTFFNQDDLFIPITNGTNITYNETSDELFQKRVFVRKLISSNLALPGQLMNVSVIVNNFGTTNLEGVLTDSFPFGFEVTQIYTPDSTSLNSSLSWDISISPRTAKRYIYELKFVDDESVGVDYFDPATLEYGDNFVYSQSVPFVRQYVAEKKVYVQKSLDFRSDGDVQVQITVRNLGETSLSNLIVKEYLGPSDEFKEITKPFREKGVWHIDELQSGEVWETSYVTDETNVLNSFPELFGVPRSGLFRNIILKNVVESKFRILQTSSVEIFGLSLLALVILAYILPHSMLLSVKRAFVKDLKMMDRELDTLKESSARKTDFHPSGPLRQSDSASPPPVTGSSVQVGDHPHSEYLQQRQEKIEQTQAILEKIKQQVNNEKKD
ncbi:MAG: hypothetical protein KC535_02225 [Nanoarchaeota archaeon]|nr:hypothetical protein [Nanoarchaeota archaeon]